MEPTGTDPTEARTRLTAERERIAGLISEIDKERSDDGPIDILSGDVGADTTQASTELGMLIDLKNELHEIDLAFARLDDGTYGIDEVTGEPIDPARLAAVPTARTNI